MDLSGYQEYNPKSEESVEQRLLRLEAKVTVLMSHLQSSGTYLPECARSFKDKDQTASLRPAANTVL